MATWAEFANAEQNLAAFARERMEGRIVYQATLRLFQECPGHAYDRAVRRPATTKREAARPRSVIATTMTST